MNANYFAAVLFIRIAVADFSGDLSAASSAADNLSGQVRSFSSGAGISGALGIQSYFPTLSLAVASLSGDAGSLQDSDVDVSTISSFASAVAGLLSALTSKAGDFSAVNAGQIVGNDLDLLSSPAAAIVSDIVSAVTSDCDKINSLTDALNSVKDGFSSAASAYSISAPAFIDPSCQGGSGGATGSSSGSSSASSESAAASGSASGSGSSSASAKSVSSSEAKSGSSSETKSDSRSETKSGSSSSAASSKAASSGASSSRASSSGSSSSALSKNTGVPIAGGLSAAAVGVIAWLL